MLLHVLRHIDADHAVLAVKQRYGQRFGQLGLADPGRPQEQERTDGAVRVLDACSCPEHSIRHQPDGLILADYPFMQRIFEPQQLIPLAFHETADRNAGPARDNVGDLLFRHSFAQQPGLLILLRGFLCGLQLPLQIRNYAVAQLGRLVQIIDLLCIDQILARLL